MAQQIFDRDLYRAALLGYERSKAEIESKITELRKMLDTPNGAKSAGMIQKPRRRKLSPAARKRIANAQRLRWARFRQQKAKSAVKA